MLHKCLALRLGNHIYSSENIEEQLQAFEQSKGENSKTEALLGEVLYFLKEWFADSPYMEVQTSGSTGKPKRIKASKEAMLKSAEMTCRALGLSRETRAILCISPKYIGGMMMIVRAMLYEMKLIVLALQSNPLEELKLDELNSLGGPQKDLFIALVPMQVKAILEQEESRELFKELDKVIIGGASIDEGLLSQLRSFPNAIYSTYGMSETLSHIALRRLSGVDAEPYYKAFPNIKLSLSEVGTLRILAPHISTEWLQTNDLVRLHGNYKFEVLGRIDNVVNSGGVKLQIEELEAKIRELISYPFALTSIPDEVLGEALVLLVEGDSHSLPNPQTIIQKLKEVLPPYSAPKQLFFCQALPLTLVRSIAKPKSL